MKAPVFAIFVVLAISQVRAAPFFGFLDSLIGEQEPGTEIGEPTEMPAHPPGEQRPLSRRELYLMRQDLLRSLERLQRMLETQIRRKYPPAAAGDCGLGRHHGGAPAASPHHEEPYHF